MDRLYEKLCKILDEMDQKDKLSASDVQIIDWVTHAKKSMLCIEEMEDKYSEDDGMSRRSYRGRSMRRGMSRDGGMSDRRSMRRNARGQFSRDDGSYDSDMSGNADFIDELEDMMREAPNEQCRQGIQKMIRELESR